MIDVKTVDVKKLTLDDLINDAVERGDKAAIEWLKAETMKKSIRKREDGTEYEARQPLTAYKNEYLTKFCGYTKPKRKTANEEKRLAELEAMFNAAIEKIERR